ncbi:hypothetical protein BAUCODRAFT_31874 [Baudoinia panamericana UAMH 10762]|uniref:Carotenoid oxygenase n=1 Tax=Baudoinia panamericana (strain UAMH 10762) TaxID=717646 RepID=M2NF37_BAUPA|nr:uncharacterized protein BAUCODRAFT_31874 [Baudoinia panamericana UAMH 10762]EMC97869.1 hypothetical protein BAUCODRAFT_31874 [Baudoinia panamericana UAMH 10762]
MLEGAPTLAAGQKRKRTSSSHTIQPTPQAKHPYLTGNFAPIQQTLPLTPCTYTGDIPDELADGEYVRNGGNPVSNEDLGRDAHWFDGDGMLSGVSFRRDQKAGRIVPEFVNQYVLTDLYLSTLSSPRLRVPILPSIATLVNPVASVIYVTFRIFRTLFLVLLSFLPGSKQKIKKISVANTHIVYHDGRALATCESGPPMRVQLPGLQTVGWYNGAWAEGERKAEEAQAKKQQEVERVLGQDGGMIAFMREWTTAHPKLDPVTKEMIMFHSSFARPYVQYSIIPQEAREPVDEKRSLQPQSKMLNAAVPGIYSAKMMHDFGVSTGHTVIMDLPLALDPMNQMKGKPPMSYDSSQPARFGVFPRRHPEQVRWFETDACCIFHTANSWDTVDAAGYTTSVNMLACRLTSATLVFATGNVAPPAARKPKTVAMAKRMSFFAKYDDPMNASVYERSALLESPLEEQEVPNRRGEAAADSEEYDSVWDENECRLYYYSFCLKTGQIEHQWALSTIAFEFPSVRTDLEMQAARYVYGCGSSVTSFGSALGKATKIDLLIKVDVQTLIARGLQRPPRSVTGSVDTRSIEEILASNDDNDPIRAFQLPEGWFAQEPRFVPASTNSSEDDGWLVFYAFDESQLTVDGEVPSDNSPLRARSELWIVNARDVRTLVARVHLPQRVPYGLHGSWFTADQIREQRAIENVRSTAKALEKREVGWWMSCRDVIERMLG